jgi:hypothetical protein
MPAVAVTVAKGCKPGSCWAKNDTGCSNAKHTEPETGRDVRTKLWLWVPYFFVASCQSMLVPALPVMMTHLRKAVPTQVASMLALDCGTFLSGFPCFGLTGFGWLLLQQGLFVCRHCSG